MESENDYKRKINLLSCINWDYAYTEDELLNIINDKGNTSNIRLCYFIKSLETFKWQDLIFLWGIEECNFLYTDKIRRGLFSKSLRDVYDGIFSLLRNKVITRAEYSSEDIENLRTTLLFNRKNRSKWGLES